MAAAASASAGGFMPPAWKDMLWLLRASLALWLVLVAFAALRAAAQAANHSAWMRHAFRVSSTRATPLQRAAVFAARRWREARHLIVRIQMPEHLIARWFGLPRFIFGVGVCVLYVVDTYMRGIPPHFYFLQALYGAAVTVNLILSFAYASRPLLFMFHLTTIFDCLSVPSLLTSNGGQWLNFNFLQAYCILMEWGVLEKYDIVLFNYPALARLLVNLVLQMITFVYITSCGVQFCELLGDPGKRIASETFQITWANSIYFAVVTLMTVGYGDFVPYTLLGRLWIVFHIIFAAYLISREISLLIDALKSMRRGGGSFVKASSSEFVVVTGHVTWEFLIQFTKEFLAERRHLDVKVVVLTFNTDWTDDDWRSVVVQNPFYDYHLIFLEGSPLKHEDLGRAKVDSAKAAFVLADPHRSDPYLEDSDTLKALLTIRNYAPDVPIYTINAVHDSSFQFKIAMEQIKPNDMRLLRGQAPSALAASRAYNTFTNLLPATSAPPNVGALKGQFTSSALAFSASGGPGQSLAGPQVQSPRMPRARFDAPEFHPAGNSRLGTSATRMGRGELPSPSGPGTPVALRTPAGLGPGNASPGLSRGGSGDDLFRSLRNSPLMQSESSKLIRGRPLGESVCMQKLEMALLAESVFCNGLSTLITNFAKRIQHESQEGDPPWLLEYKLGAECCIQFREMPEAFCGRRVSEVAVVLYDYGIVMLAVRRSAAHNWRLLRTDTILEEGMITALLTYHEGNVIGKIVNHANQFILNRERQMAVERAAREAEAALSPEIGRRTDISQSEVVGAVHSGELDDAADVMADVLDDSPTQLGRSHAADLGSAAQPGNRVDPATSQGGPETSSRLSPRPIGVGVSPLSAALRMPPAKRSQVPPFHDLPTSIASSAAAPQRRPRTSGAGDTESAKHHTCGMGRSASASSARKGPGGRDPSSSDDESGHRGQTSRDGLKIYSNRDRLRVELSEHIIVCLDGENSLLSLDYLLRRIRIKRNGDEGNTPVVVINSSFPKNFEREVGHHADCVYLLKGNFLAKDTMKQAQFETSRCILLMAADSSATGSTDSKAIFTVMTLDALLWDNSRTFLCCVLDAEESLHLLQSPRRQRRMGVSLGVHREGSAHHNRDRRGLPGSNSFHHLAPRTTSVGSFAPHSVESSPAVHMFSSGASGLDPIINTSVSFGLSSLRHRLSTTGSGAVARRSHLLGRRAPSRSFIDSDGSGDDVPANRSRAHALKSQHWSQHARDFTETREPQRFASGEMMISSLFSGLLVREYVSPGFVQLIRELIGTGTETEQCWIRQIVVPESWIESSNAIDGRTYRETVERLIELGCIPIGLYRSGDAPVRMQFDEDDAAEDDDSGVSASPGASDYRDNYMHISRTLSQLAIDAPLMAGSYLSLHDELQRLRGNSDEFDEEMYYECPTTHRRIRYREASNGENMLPFVYTNPEPYTIVAASDGVFVLCPPDLCLPANWHET